MNSVHKYIVDKIENGEKLHFTLIDPDKVSDYDELEKLADEVKHYGSDAFLIGGSIAVTPDEADETARVLKKTGLPVIVFPGNINCITRYADAILYMILMNSINTYYLIEAQVSAAPIVKKYGLETLPTAYIVIYGDTSVAHIGRIYPIPVNKPEIVLAYGLAAEMLGMKYVYLEAGSGARDIVPPQMVNIVKKNTKLIVIVGGGIKNRELAEKIISSGADIIVTGTIVEHEPGRLKDIISVVKKHTSF
ncbi:MAG: geranylgeranylglyceryl/heptaprenylglyceryl phosphate synthase [Desulfurococcaceae archaeon]